MNDVQLASFQIISAVGAAKSYYIEAIRAAEKGAFAEAAEKMKEGRAAYKEGHDVHFKLLQGEAGGDSQLLSILLVHAEDQLMSAETIQLLAEQMIATNQRLYKLEKQ
ncbi:PTS lactose/cellobiose transporter subunit IIA [Streptococcus panodentis]|uniref:PTS lactose/cellobiose transporter subunit IIA n=1 Tax=Streptococcus panodentis TaxID=1581472 RepID=A0ABS5AWH8_9STRE|nr:MULTISPECIES: PTS lactose/cellobiose transporter subunit IIA [Streptococcus]KXT84624.1 PTS system, cellobiose-specific IIA component [Streptococcus sp. DD11]MBP2620932.1 PTS lactose/cellobiose transporter subunit IIA [Streptococcus panodentis]